MTIKKVSVIGLGYVGLGLGVSASKFNKVIGFDLNQEKIAKLKSGNSYIEDVPSEDLRDALDSGRFVPTSDASQLTDSDVIVICVPTPLDSNHKPDMSYIEKATTLISEYVTKSCLIINESTSYPGTLREFIRSRTDSDGLIGHLYASAPERIDPGNKNWTLKSTPRLISGLSNDATTKALEFYSAFSSNLVEVQSPEVAETAKLFENTFRQVNIALVNELATICNSIGISVYDVINAANTKPYGFMKFTPGPGVGGHCIPVDPSYLAYRAKELGVEARFIDLANKVNLDMPNYVISRCENILGDLKNKSILLAGVAYKPDIADVRETPAELLRNAAIAKGASVSWFDPIIEVWESGKIEKLESQSFDLVIFQTIHKSMDIEIIRSSAKYAFDCTGKVSGIPSI